MYYANNHRSNIDLDVTFIINSYMCTHSIRTNSRTNFASAELGAVQNKITNKKGLLFL